MAGQAWIVDSSRIAKKIKSVSASSDPQRIKFESNPTKACPNCLFVIDNSDVAEEWPGLPLGVKFDPTDQEIIWHLCAKVGLDGFKPHPFIDHFIITVDNDDGICYTHPQNLPGVKQDGSVSHFFHRAIKAYNTGTRKRRKVQGDDFGDVRWHKTGRTKPVTLDGKHMGCKKIMVLYMNRGRSSEKTNWVMHQYHLGTGEEESDGQYVISKISYQQQSTNKGEKPEEHLSDTNDAIAVKVDPVTPESETPDPPCAERRCPDLDAEQNSTDNGTDRQYLEVETENLEVVTENLEVETGNAEYQVPPKCGDAEYNDQPQTANHDEKMVDHDKQVADNNDDYAEDYPKWSQDILDSQQLAEGLSLVDEFFRSQSPNRDGNDVEKATGRPCLSDYAKLGAEHLKKDIEECQDLVLDPANILMDDTPPEFRLSQLEFGSQDSYLSWGVPKGD